MVTVYFGSIWELTRGTHAVLSPNKTRAAQTGNCIVQSLYCYETKWLAYSKLPALNRTASICERLSATHPSISTRGRETPSRLRSMIFALPSYIYPNVHRRSQLACSTTGMDPHISDQPLSSWPITEKPAKGLTIHYKPSHSSFIILMHKGILLLVVAILQQRNSFFIWLSSYGGGVMDPLQILRRTSAANGNQYVGACRFCSNQFASVDPHFY